MNMGALLALTLMLFITACGVKNDLQIPDGLPQSTDTEDDDTLGSQNPSRPPQPLGQ